MSASTAIISTIRELQLRAMYKTTLFRICLGFVFWVWRKLHMHSILPRVSVQYLCSNEFYVKGANSSVPTIAEHNESCGTSASWANRVEAGLT